MTSIRKGSRWICDPEKPTPRNDQGIPITRRVVIDTADNRRVSVLLSGTNVRSSLSRGEFLTLFEPEPDKTGSPIGPGWVEDYPSIDQVISHGKTHPNGLDGRKRNAAWWQLMEDGSSVPPISVLLWFQSGFIVGGTAVGVGQFSIDPENGAIENLWKEFHESMTGESVCVNMSHPKTWWRPILPDGTPVRLR